MGARTYAASDFLHLCIAGLAWHILCAGDSCESCSHEIVEMDWAMLLDCTCISFSFAYYQSIVQRQRLTARQRTMCPRSEPLRRWQTFHFHLQADAQSTTTSSSLQPADTKVPASRSSADPCPSRGAPSPPGTSKRPVAPRAAIAAARPPIELLLNAPVLPCLLRHNYLCRYQAFCPLTPHHTLSRNTCMLTPARGSVCSVP